MNLWLSVIILFLGIVPLYSQNTFKVFTSRYGDEISEEFAAEVRVYQKLSDSRWHCTVFDLKSEFKLTEYECTKILPDEKDGIVKLYYPNGTLSAEYTITKEVMSGPFKEYYLDGTLEVEGAYENDQKVGLWKYYYPNGLLHGRITYRNGDKVQWQYFAEDGKVIKKVYEDSGPEFPGGAYELYRFLSSMPYPPEMREKNVAGVVEISFVVDTNGKVANPTVRFSSDTAFSVSALQTFNNMPKWRPAYDKNRKVMAMSTLTFTFYPEKDIYQTLSSELRDAGIDAFENQKYVEAYKLFKEAVYLDPRKNRNILYLGVAALNINNIPEACKCFEYLYFRQLYKDAEQYIHYCDWQRYNSMPIPPGAYVVLPQ